MINRILVPIDGSECGYKALDWALDLAEQYGAEIVLLTVIPTAMLAIVGPSEKELQERAENILDETLKKADKVKPNLKITVKTLFGRPSEKIVETCREGRFDLIVMGSRGLGGVKEFFLGSVVDRVADEAACPIVIIK